MKVSAQAVHAKATIASVMPHCVSPLQVTPVGKMMVVMEEGGCCGSPDAINFIYKVYCGHRRAPSANVVASANSRAYLEM